MGIDGINKWYLKVNPSLPWPQGFFPYHSNVGDSKASSWSFTLLSEAAAEQAKEFFEYHRCAGK